MTQEEINERNEAIAVFLGGKVEVAWYVLNHPVDHTIEGKWVADFRNMGLKTGGVDNKMLLSNALFHSSWDWLMPVVNKIKALGYPIGIYLSHTHNSCEIIDLKTDKWIFRHQSSDPIEAVFITISDLCKWYNSNQ